jgi:multidrug efflux pump subunit AcrA (membrane-fusion protein)
MKSMFRQNALADVSSPEQLNRHIKVVRPGAWVAALSILSIAAGFLAWAFFGSYTAGETAYGIIFPEGGIATISNPAPGIISHVNVRAGDTVRAGDVLAVIPQEDILRLIRESREQGANEAETEALISEYRRLSFVRASYDGRVTAVADAGAFVSAGDTVATILVHSPLVSEHQVLAFVPSAATINLRLGMEAQVSPTFASREEFGYMRGYISSIGSYPVTRAGMHDSMLAFVDDVLPGTSFVEVVITLLPDAESANLINWSNPNGRTLSVDIGTACRIQIITVRSRPVYRVFRGGV